MSTDYTKIANDIAYEGEALYTQALEMTCNCGEVSEQRCRACAKWNQATSTISRRIQDTFNELHILHAQQIDAWKRVCAQKDAALRQHIDWHTHNDDFGGWPDSQLCENTCVALQATVLPEALEAGPMTETCSCCGGECDPVPAYPKSKAVFWFGLLAVLGIVALTAWLILH